MKLEGLCITRALITSILSSWSVHRRWRIDSWFLSGLKMETPTRDCRRDISCENLWIKETLPADNDIWMVTATHNCSEPLLIFILIFHPLPGPVPGPHFCCQTEQTKFIFPWVFGTSGWKNKEASHDWLHQKNVLPVHVLHGREYVDEHGVLYLALLRSVGDGVVFSLLCYVF